MIDNSEYDKALAVLREGPPVLVEAVNVLARNRDAYKRAYEDMERAASSMVSKLDRRPLAGKTWEK